MVVQDVAVEFPDLNSRLVRKNPRMALRWFAQYPRETMVSSSMNDLCEQLEAGSGQVSSSSIPALTRAHDGVLYHRVTIQEAST